VHSYSVKNILYERKKLKETARMTIG